MATILYIEDNAQNHYLVAFLLAARGHTVLWAQDGPAGIAMALDHAPALILLDIQLPVMDGYQVAKALRAQRSLLDVPIIALTSYAMAGDRERALEAGCNGYIEKPINPEIFNDQVERYLIDGVREESEWHAS
jgi:CheY-like chemotaxis protein